MKVLFVKISEVYCQMLNFPCVVICKTILYCHMLACIVIYTCPKIKTYLVKWHPVEGGCALLNLLFI
jgi:hypothetical protein